MRRILSERNLVVVLFVMALVVFVFAQQDTKKIEKIYMDHNSASSSLMSSPRQSASNLSANSVATGNMR
jgi:cell shape-determining protein MreC